MENQNNIIYAISYNFDNYFTISIYKNKGLLKSKDIKNNQFVDEYCMPLTEKNDGIITRKQVDYILSISK